MGFAVEIANTPEFWQWWARALALVVFALILVQGAISAQDED